MERHRKKVAILCFSPYWGGMELDALRLYEKLEETCHVWLVGKDGSHLHQYAISTDHSIEHYHSIAFRSMFSLSLIGELRAFIKGKDIDNIIFFGASEMRSIFFALLGLDVNLIVRHGTTKSHRKKDLLHRLLYSKVKHYVTISKHLVGNIHEIMPVSNKSNVHLIYPSFKFSTPARKEEKKGKINIIHVGRLVKGKGQDAAIKACSILFENDIPFNLYLVGRSEEKYKAELDSLLEGLPCRASVVFCGHEEDVYPGLYSSQIFLFPSSGEGFGNALVEALSCGLVCIVYSNTTMPEIMSLGFHGHLVKDGDEEALKKKLLYVAGNLDEEIKKCEKNMSLAREVFAVEREVAQYDSILV